MNSGVLSLLVSLFMAQGSLAQQPLVGTSSKAKRKHFEV